MKTLLQTGVLLALAVPTAVFAQSTTVFSDNFSSSTINGNDTVSGPTPPTSTSTSYDFDSQKTGSESISSGSLNMTLASATTGGFVEAEALFTTTPVALSVGNYIDLTYTFTDSGNLLAGGSASAIYTGLYNSGGTAPIAGNGASGNAVSLNTTGAPTGGAQGWQGYVGRIEASGGTSEAYTRPAQTGGSASGTSSAQDLLGNSGFTDAYGKASPGVAGATVGGSMASTVTLSSTSGQNQYSVDYRLTLTATGQMTILDTLTVVDGPNAGNVLSTQTSVTTASEFISGLTSFDGFAIGILNSGTSLDPDMDLNSIVITDNIVATPEPSSFTLLGGGLALLGFAWRRSQQPRCSS